jgi:signal transduction histidine kinase
MAQPARLLVVSPLVVDGLLAAVLLAVGLSEVAFGFRDGGVGQPLSGPPLAEVVVVAALTVPLSWRRWRPLPALVVVAAALTAQVLFLSPSAPFAVGLVPLLLLTFDVARGGGLQAAAGLAIGAGALAITSNRVPAMRAPGEVVFSSVLIAGIWLVGRYAGHRHRQAEQLATYAARVELEQGQRAQEAIVAERARIARELHDVVAHSVSLMGVQAGAARTLLEADPERARRALLLIEATARDAVGELGRLLGVLRAGDQAPDVAPQPGLGELAPLLAEVRDAGITLAVRVEGDQRPLSPGVDLAAYRLVQEALTNVVRHAGPCTAELHIRYADKTVEIEVSDEGRTKQTNGRSESPGCGHGLIGMRERVAIYGGNLDAGPVPGDGFLVRAVLPTGAGQ